MCSQNARANLRLQKNLMTLWVIGHSAAILKLKERFETARTHFYPHLGIINTSRVKGAHTTIKRWFKVSTMDLRDVKTNLSNCLQQQWRIRTAVAAAETRVYHDLNGRIYYGVVGKVSRFPLRKINIKSRRFWLAGSCTYDFEAIYGLPC